MHASLQRAAFVGLPRDFNRRCLNHRRASVSAQPSSHLQCLVDPQGASPSPLLNVEHNRNGKNGNLHRQPSSLLQWLVDSKGASPSPLKVERKYQGKVKGWGMVADEDIAAHDIILSVPLTATITSQNQKWSISMAGTFLSAFKHPTAPISAWIDALPTHVPLPWLYWDEASIMELQDADTIAEAHHLQTIFHHALQKYTPLHSKEDVAWALSLVHSRSFLSSAGMHVWVPGVDLCNHTFDRPNAVVRCTHNPDACQGAAATEEIAPPPPPHLLKPSCFELIAGEGGIAKGEEVKISYGAWPNDVLLMFFGFVPHSNVNDAMVMFEDLQSLADFLFSSQRESLLMEKKYDDVVCAEFVHALETELQVEASSGAAAAAGEGYHRMIATAEGLDGRLTQSIQTALFLIEKTITHSSMTVPQVIVSRCRQLLNSFPTTLEEDEKILTVLIDDDDDESLDDRQEQLKTAIRYRMGKKKILMAVLEHFT